MVLVLVVHTGFVSIGTPSLEDVASQPMVSFARFSLQSFSVVCVNLFILLSGWFGIKPKKIRFFELIFQVLFFLLLGLLISIISSKLGCLPELTKKEIILGITLLSPQGYWFVLSYLLLYILSPVLNAYTGMASIELQQRILIAFFVFEFIFGWMSTGVLWFVKGYSTVSFVGLYLLAYYLRHATREKTYVFLRLPARYYFYGYIFISFFTACCAFIFAGNSYVVERLYFYNSPFVVLSSICLFLFFSKLRLQKQTINWIASSSFAIYLFHCNPFLFNSVYTNIINHLYNHYPFFTWIIIVVLFICLVFIISILFDRIRILLWNKVRMMIFK